MARIGIVGLGIIGTAVARHLLEDGDEVVGFDIDTGRGEVLTSLGGVAVASPRETADRSDLIFTAVASLGALSVIATGPDGLASSTRRGFALVDFSTLPLQEKETVRAALAAVGIPMVDCPISGTGAQVEARDAVFMASGDPAAVTAVLPILRRLGKGACNVGRFGDGSKMKFIANLMVAIHSAVAGEALALAEKAGLDPAQVLEVISSGAGNSRMWEVRGPLIVERRYQEPTARVSMMIKDTHLITDFARSVGAATPLLDAARGLYEQAAASGLADWDVAAVHALIATMEPGGAGG
ncbi:MAG: NAD(P)-dependent oxidoreductase [Actinomycetota bacterium]